ncbi:uncharacterized protein LOC143283188 [Babylonia areolata]|uniref:uncharacterized protein LOC143283188 n=1 Tax=Babylonia areolata TaxID=304850 RepID=UPI003FD5403C
MPRKSQGKYLKYDRNTLENALQAIKERHMSIKAASKESGVPRSTLTDHVHGRSNLEMRPGRKRSIPEEIENEIVDKAIAAVEAGFPLTKRTFLIKIGTIVKQLKLKTMFKNDTPGDDYWRCLKERRPDLVIRSAEACGINRMRGTRRKVVMKYFDDLEKMIQDLNLEGKPQCIWNCDETGLNGLK